MNQFKAAIITISDKGSRGEREDASGPLLAQLVIEMGMQIITRRILPDDPEQIAALLAKLADNGGLDLILTTGGTGPSPCGAVALGDCDRVRKTSPRNDDK